MVSKQVSRVVAVDDDELDDLRSRLLKTRWPPRWPQVWWEAGTNPDELQRLVGYWGRGLRLADAGGVRSTPCRGHVADLDGLDVHYLQFRAERDGALPLVLTNGWPSSFLELVELARRLSDPAALRRRPDRCLPRRRALPARLRLHPAAPPLLDATPTHELWHRLMSDELGYTRYGAHGGDLGAGTTALLAQAHPDAVVGIHLLAVADPIDLDPASVTPEEQAYLDQVATWHRDEGAYEHQQHTRPLTLAYGLDDSPAGLLAWILEKYRAWTDRDGDLQDAVQRRLPPHPGLALLVHQHHLDVVPALLAVRPRHQPAVTRVEVPTAVAVFPADLAHPPPSWVERSYRLTRYTRMPRGGHFAAHEEPALLAADLTAFFADLRGRKARQAVA